MIPRSKRERCICDLPPAANVSAFRQAQKLEQLQRQQEEEQKKRQEAAAAAAADAEKRRKRELYRWASAHRRERLLTAAIASFVAAREATTTTVNKMKQKLLQRKACFAIQLWRYVSRRLGQRHAMWSARLLNGRRGSSGHRARSTDAKTQACHPLSSSKSSN